MPDIILSTLLFSIYSLQFSTIYLVSQHLCQVENIIIIPFYS